MSSQVVPPPFIISADDKRGLIVVTAAATLSFVWTCWLIRIWLRLTVREWKADDYFLAAATVLYTVQSALVFQIVNRGFGTSEEGLSELDLQKIAKGDFASQILYILTLLLSKVAVLALYLRLSPAQRHTLASWSAIALSSVWALAAVILIAVPCNPIEFWTKRPATCSGVASRWQAIGAIDIAIEIYIFGIAVYLVARLNMKFKSKAMVVAAFSARLPVLAMAAVRIHYITSTLSSPNRTLEGTYYVVSTQWELGYAIMSSTITGLGPFLRPFSDSYSTSYRSYGDHNSHPVPSQNQSGNHSQAGVSYPLTPLGSRKPSNNSKNRDYKGNMLHDTMGPDGEEFNHLGTLDFRLRPDAEEFRRDTNVHGGSDAIDEEYLFNRSRSSNESRRMIITKKTVLTVETDRASAVGSPFYSSK
ncbi:hypothetical protein P154DRAFT_520505 [Amniculicola lignicola CBS 123094]|uniref:Rhodopsin domain-containing protein n=1 Tax=Amniculicola lignicola CBS 123094 TaxID=1392246 RepID=A0A6A5WN63_9PLEO|nr:hypothetical protein P154DRAFT_520505 [Amniculicola lignicola CBS 123094]